MSRRFVLPHESVRARFPSHRSTRLDPYATGYAFNGWRDAPPPERPGQRDLFLVWFPRTWLLRAGWQRHGLIPTWEVPG